MKKNTFQNSMSFLVILLCATLLYVTFMNKRNVEHQDQGQSNVVYKETFIKQNDTPRYRRINIPSRGEMPAFKNIGYISNETSSGNDKDLLPLYGRPTYQGSHKWNYYTMHEGVRVPIDGCDDSRGCDEKYDNDVTVTVNPLAGGDVYKVGLYNDGVPKYIPY